MSGLFGSDSWLYIILIGFFVGLLGRFFMPGNNRMGCLLTIVLGIAGAVFAGWFGREMGWYAAGQPAGFVGAIIGAIALLALLRLSSGGNKRGLPSNGACGRRFTCSVHERSCFRSAAHRTTPAVGRRRTWRPCHHS